MGNMKGNVPRIFRLLVLSGDKVQAAACPPQPRRQPPGPESARSLCPTCLHPWNPPSRRLVLLKSVLRSPESEYHLECWWKHRLLGPTSDLDIGMVRRVVRVCGQGVCGRGRNLHLEWICPGDIHALWAWDLQPWSSYSHLWSMNGHRGTSVSQRVCSWSRMVLPLSPSLFLCHGLGQATWRQLMTHNTQSKPHFKKQTFEIDIWTNNHTILCETGCNTGRFKVFQGQGKRSNTFRGADGRYKVTARNIFKEVALRWALKEQQAFVRLRKKKKAFKADSQGESYKSETYLGTSLAWPPNSQYYDRVIIIIDFDSTRRPADELIPPRTLLGYSEV